MHTLDTRLLLAPTTDLGSFLELQEVDFRFVDSPFDFFPVAIIEIKWRCPVQTTSNQQKMRKEREKREEREERGEGRGGEKGGSSSSRALGY